MEQEQEAAKEQNRATQQIIQDLNAEHDALSQTDRQRFISQALRRVSTEATVSQREEVSRLAGMLFDEKEALESVDAKELDPTGLGG